MSAVINLEGFRMSERESTETFASHWHSASHICLYMCKCLNEFFLFNTIDKKYISLLPAKPLLTSLKYKSKEYGGRGKS